MAIYHDLQRLSKFTLRGGIQVTRYRQKAALSATRLAPAVFWHLLCRAHRFCSAGGVLAQGNPRDYGSDSTIFKEKGTLADALNSRSQTDCPICRGRVWILDGRPADLVTKRTLSGTCTLVCIGCHAV